MAAHDESIVAAFHAEPQCARDSFVDTEHFVYFPFVAKLWAVDIGHFHLDSNVLTSEYIDSAINIT